MLVCVFLVTVPEDLSLEERDELSNIRRRKKELLDDIEVRMQSKIKCVYYVFIAPHNSSIVSCCCILNKPIFPK